MTTSPLSRGFAVSVGKAGPYEVDFVAEGRDTRRYVQVCYRMETAERRECELRPLRSIDDNYPKAFLSLDDTAGGDAEGIRLVNLTDFLLRRAEI